MPKKSGVYSINGYFFSFFLSVMDGWVDGWMGVAISEGEIGETGGVGSLFFFFFFFFFFSLDFLVVFGCGHHCDCWLSLCCDLGVKCFIVSAQWCQCNVHSAVAF